MAELLAESERLADELNQHLAADPTWVVAPPAEIQAITRQSLGALQAYVAVHLPEALTLDSPSSLRAGKDPSESVPTANAETLLAAERRLMGSIQNLSPLLAITHSKLEQAEQDLEDLQGLEKSIIFASLALSALAAGLIAWIATRQITYPLTAAAGIAQRVVETGEFKERVTPALGGLGPETEVGSLARSLDTLIEWVAARNQALAEQAADAQTQAQTLKQTLRELRRTQIQLVQTEKMSLLGQVAAGVAHEINNPINFIHGNIQHIDSELGDMLELLMLCKDGVPPQNPRIQALLESIDIDFLRSDLPKMLQSMQLGSERIREIVLSLRLFTRLDESELKRIDLNESIDSVVTILGSRLCAQANRPAIALSRNYGQLPELECYAGQLNQALMHFMANAIDAMDAGWKQFQAGGSLGTAPLLQLTITTAHLAHNYIGITIADTGQGIPESVLPNIFEMFYSTKPAGKGTGMGLAIAHQVITDKHGGTIECTTHLGQGTTFSIELPLRPMAPRSEPQASPAASEAI